MLTPSEIDQYQEWIHKTLAKSDGRIYVTTEAWANALDSALSDITALKEAYREQLSLWVEAQEKIETLEYELSLWEERWQ